MPMYLVTVTPNEPFQRLVNAKNRAQAIGHVIDNCITADVPNPRQLMELGKADVMIEEAGEQKQAAE